MGDRTWANFNVYAVAGPAEVEEICRTLENMGLGVEQDAPRMTELVLYEDYSDGQISVGTCEDAAVHLAVAAPRSAWVFHQDSYGGDDTGTDCYHFPGLGLYRCDSANGGPVWSNDQVDRFVAMGPADRGAAMGKPWLQAAAGFAAYLQYVPLEQRTIKRPTPDEVESFITEREAVPE